ncbi:MAG TPA: sialate O-acetylesterase, partial [Phycisphaerae bacterium]|nr:sialate O-acetylesterase [Phycisphaerae bacterium]
RGERLTGFAVAGPDKKFDWAEATVKGGTVIVTSDSVSDVRAVRYAWADNPECNLYNKERLPAVPFRTDE